MYGKIRFLSKYKKSGGTQVSLEYDTMYDYITQGAIIRSRATWYEFGERNNGKSLTGKES